MDLEGEGGHWFREQRRLPNRRCALRRLPSSQPPGVFVRALFLYPASVPGAPSTPDGQRPVLTVCTQSLCPAGSDVRDFGLWLTLVVLGRGMLNRWANWPLFPRDWIKNEPSPSKAFHLSCNTQLVVPALEPASWEGLKFIKGLNKSIHFCEP